MYRIASTLILLSVLARLVYGQTQYAFLQVNNSDGLVNNQVTCIHKDSYGFIWIGTLGGLSRYDGTTFQSYKHHDEGSSLLSNNIINIQEERHGNLWVKTNSGYVVYDVLQDCFYHDIGEYLDLDIDNKVIGQVYIDPLKHIWIKFYDQQYYQRYNPKEKTLESVFDVVNVDGRWIEDFKYSNGAYYILYNNGGVACYNSDTFDLRYENNDLVQSEQNKVVAYHLFVDLENDLWAYGGNNGLFLYNSERGSWLHFHSTHQQNQLTSNLVNDVIADENGLIWIATDHGGINVYNKYTNEMTTLNHQPGNDKSIAQNSVTDLYIDDNNIIWIGTYKNGVSYYHENIHKFPHIHQILSDNATLPFSDVNCFSEDEAGNIWIGTNGGGLIYYDREREEYTSYTHSMDDPQSISNNVVVSLHIDGDGTLWIGTYDGGLNRFDGNTFIHYSKENNSGLTNNNIWTIAHDKLNRLLVGTLGGGIFVYQPDSDTFKRLHNSGTLNLPTPFVSKIQPLRNGNLFIATSAGVSFYDIKEQRYKNHPSDNRKNPYDLGHQSFFDVFEDSRGLLWTASRDGLHVVNPNNDFAKYFDGNDGVPRDIINCILEDDGRHIWLSTSSGLIQIVVNENVNKSEYTFECFNYTTEDGLQGKEFNPQAKLRTNKDELIFGGVNGYNIFKTTNIQYNNVPPRVVITDFYIYDKALKPTGSEVQRKNELQQSMIETDEIVIDHSMNVFTIQFTALDFFIPEKIRYQFQLVGFDQDWVTLDQSRHSATYTNLNPGEYTFCVRAANNDGVWSSDVKQLNIRILPPPYATTFAFIIYGLIVISIGFILRRRFREKSRVKFELQQERMLARKNHELDEMKLKFLTNVSHEFRTPITLILTPLHKLLNEVDKKSHAKLLHIIDRNAQQLLNLVNQLLDFRKLELDGLKYVPTYANLTQFLHDIIQNFEGEFAQKNISLVFQHHEDAFMLEFDGDKLKKVMMNLLSNALKFTPEHGTVTLKLKTDDNAKEVLISVQDTGIGIRSEELDLIFTRFYQSEGNEKLGVSGSGIGLNLAQEMIHLHNGNITVESEPNRGSTFTIALPLKQADIQNVDSTDSNSAHDSDDHDVLLRNGTQRPSILLVEDHIDFRTFMAETLQDNFDVYQACDGKQGLQMVHQKMPDMIISDVMMPNIDGLEMCAQLRNDIRTSHIPIILLTARTADEDKIKGLEIGADDYITKPFNMDLLMLRVHKLIERRQKMQKDFQEGLEIKPSEIQITSIDEKLIAKAITIIEDHMSNSELSVEMLSQELGMSRVHLYKKLTSITGKSPIEFIRVIRLKRGAQLLEKSQMNVGEVAYEVGFNSPRLFSKYFKEEYGMLPSSYMKKNQTK